MVLRRILLRVTIRVGVHRRRMMVVPSVPVHILLLAPGHMTMLPIVIHGRRQVPAWGYFTQLVARGIECFEVRLRLWAARFIEPDVKMKLQRCARAGVVQDADICEVGEVE